MKKIFTLLLAFLLAGALVFAGGKQEKTEKLKAGFIYVGPVGDYGWTYAHDQGRKYVEKKFTWLKTVYVESVAESDVARIIDRLVQEENCKVIFTTSFGYMDATIAAGKKYPNVIFEHCSGFKRSKNVGTYFAELYQVYYLNGLMAGAMTKSNVIGYVGAYPIPEVVRHIDAFALGIKAVNPKAKVKVRWLYSWYNPQKAKEAAEMLVAGGVDALAFTEDSPSVLQVAEEHPGVYAFSHYSPMEKFAPNSCISGQLVNWGVMYEKILNDIHNGTWKSEDLWWRMDKGAALLGGSFKHPINPKFIKVLQEKGVYNLVMKRRDEFKHNAFEPFTGPLYDNKGKLRLKKGEVATKDFLLNINFYVDNVVGSVPK